MKHGKGKVLRLANWTQNLANYAWKISRDFPIQNLKLKFYENRRNCEILDWAGIEIFYAPNLLNKEQASSTSSTRRDKNREKRWANLTSIFHLFRCHSVLCLLTHLFDMMEASLITPVLFLSSFQYDKRILTLQIKVKVSAIILSSIDEYIFLLFSAALVVSWF